MVDGTAFLVGGAAISRVLLAMTRDQDHTAVEAPEQIVAALRRVGQEVLQRLAKDYITGLGLSPVYGVAERSGAAAEIDSELGKGTTVRLFLPRAGQPGVTNTAEAQPKAEQPVRATLG